MAALVSVIGLILMTQACLPDLLHTSRMIIAVASRNVQRAEQNQVLCSAMKGCGEGFLGFVAARPAGLRRAGDHPLPRSGEYLGADSSEILLRPNDVADIVGNIPAVPGRIEIGELSLGAGSLNEQANGPQRTVIACRSRFRLPGTNAGGCTC